MNDSYVKTDEKWNWNWTLEKNFEADSPRHKHYSLNWAF